MQNEVWVRSWQLMSVVVIGIGDDALWADPV